MDVIALQSLSRFALQKLAKDNQIKANLKTEVIIQLLSERYAKQNAIVSSPEVPPTFLRTAARVRNSKSPRSPNSTASANAEIAAEGVKRSSDTEPANINLQNPTGIDQRTSQSPQTCLEGDDYSRRLPSTDSLAALDDAFIDVSELESTPCLLKDSAETIIEITKTDEVTLRKIAELRDAAARLRRKAADLHAILRAEQGMRRRIESYTTYWMRINPRWTYDEVWSGEIRVRDMYTGREISTSDEEGSFQDDHPLPDTVDQQAGHLTPVL